MSNSTDKLTEKQMATYLGTTHRALQAKRYRNQIPEGVWNLVGRTIYYSKRRYEEWRETQWVCHLELKSETDPYELDSPKGSNAVVKPSHTRQHKLASKPQAVYVIR